MMPISKNTTPDGFFNIHLYITSINFDFIDYIGVPASVKLIFLSLK